MPPPIPPPGVPPLEETKGNGRKLTTREQMEKHRANPTCAGCHDKIDPLGFSLENYDVIGRWRASDEGGPIDATAKMVSGRKFTGPQGLKQMFADRKEEFAQATLERLMTYALGRELEARDLPAVRRILRRTAGGEYRFHDLVLGVTQSVPFALRENQER